MVAFRDTVDAHVVDVLHGDALVAQLQWTLGREPRITVVGGPEFTVSEVRTMLLELSKRIAAWVNVETERAMGPIRTAFTDPSERRWRVNAEGSRPLGSVSEAELRTAYASYAGAVGSHALSFEQFHDGDRSLSYRTITTHLGHEPKTWTPFPTDQRFLIQPLFDAGLRRSLPVGTLGEAEAREVHEAHAKRATLAQQCTFDYRSVTELLGHEPRTWIAGRAR